jgi:glycolate oxidase FAD binding subunit
MIEQTVKSFYPETEAEVAEILVQANRQKWAVDIRGGGTKQTMAGVMPEIEAVVYSQKLDKVIDYTPEDLTITVQAGMPFDRLSQILAENGQWLPLDPPFAENATVGGVIATDVSGPKRLLYGTARDLLIGAKFGLADGSTGKSGGRVVKNVTGYDLHKLMIGSFGTLGMLTELTFKVLPKPQSARWGIATFEEADTALVVARNIARSNLSPAALEVLRTNRGWELFFAAEGLAVAVNNQLAGMQNLCEKAGATETLLHDEEVSQRCWDNLRRQIDSKQTVLRFGTRPTDTALAVKLIQEHLIITNHSIQSRAGVGLTYLYHERSRPTIDYLVEFTAIVRAEMAKIGGNLVVESAPTELRQRLNVWGDFSSALAPMRDIKRQFDQHNILGAGKFNF